MLRLLVGLVIWIFAALLLGAASAGTNRDPEAP
jgi:hypothetical protein